MPSSAITRLEDAAHRLRHGRVRWEGVTLRTEQAPVASDFALLLEHATEAASRKEPKGSPWSRIVLPPRTGKTAVAAFLIGASGLASTFIVPTKALVEQSVRSMRAYLPNIPVGAFYSERREVVTGGVNVTTYASLVRHHAAGTLPSAITDVDLVFVDEAHHAMTEGRIATLRDAFGRHALRVGLTATPDYDSSRALVRFFPWLLHEITLEDALDLRLLAPLRFWLAEIDADASKVRVTGGDFDGAELGRALSGAAVFEAAALFRYAPTNTHRPALVACASRQQARDLHAYLSQARPPQARPVGLLLGETPGDERERLLGAYEAGEVDTIVQVGVLLEGWNSPRCKLLIDLAPSLSRVRATQKLFRVMTRTGDTEARVILLVPSGLGADPVLPTDLFGGSLTQYEAGALLGGDERGTSAPLELAEAARLPRVTIRPRVTVAGSLTRPLLDRSSLAQTLSVLASSPGFDPENPCGLRAFRSLRFRHALYTGSGAGLLGYLGCLPSTRGYHAMLQWLGLTGTETDEGRLCREDARHVIEAIRGGRETSSGDLAGALRAIRGHDGEPLETPEQTLIAREEAVLALSVAAEAPRRRQRMLFRAFGLHGEVEHLHAAIAEAEGSSRTRVGQIVAQEVASLRRALFRDRSGELRTRATVGARAKPCFEPEPHRATRRGKAEEEDAYYHARLFAMETPLPSSAAGRLAEALEGVALDEPRRTSWHVGTLAQETLEWGDPDKLFVRAVLLREARKRLHGGDEIVAWTFGEIGVAERSRVFLEGKGEHFSRIRLEGTVSWADVTRALATVAYARSRESRAESHLGIPEIFPAAAAPSTTSVR